MKTQVIRFSDVVNCPKTSMLPGHYLDDGTCKCSMRKALEIYVELRERQIREMQVELKRITDEVKEIRRTW